MVCELSEVRAMLKGKYKNFLVAVLLLAYVGQGLAAATMTCKNMASHSAFIDQPVKTGACSAHSKHVSNSSGNNTDSSECCPHCDCFLGGCSTSALPVAVQIVGQTRSSVCIYAYMDSASSLVAPSLFRPPIVT